MTESKELLFKDEVFAIMGAAMEVHSTLGCGFLEAVYKEAFGLEMSWRNIAYEAEKELTVIYKGIPLNKKYVADFLVFGEVIVEVKATEKLTPRDEAQLLNYLHATGKRVGLLINFGSKGKLEWKRLVV